MKHLDEFAVTGELSKPMVEALTSLLASMDTSWQNNNSFAPIPGQSPFGRYEQALTVNEIVGPSSSHGLRQKLGDILGGTIRDVDRKAVVHSINEFLYDLENKALHTYSEHSNEREW